MPVLGAFLHIRWALFLTDTKQRQHEHAGALKESGKIVAAVENNMDFSREVIVNRITDLVNEMKEKTKHGLKESLDEIGDMVEERDMIDFPDERKVLLAGVPERRDETGSGVNLGRDKIPDVPKERWGEIDDIMEERRDQTADVLREWRDEIADVLEDERGETGHVPAERKDKIGDVVELRRDDIADVSDDRRGQIDDVVKERKEEAINVLEKSRNDIDVLKETKDKIGDEMEESSADINHVQEKGIGEMADVPEEDRDEIAEVVGKRGEGD